MLNKEDHLNFWHVTFLGSITLIIYIPFNTVQNLISSIEEDNGFGDLGYILLGILYFMQMIGGLLGSGTLSKLGVNMTFFVGGILLSMVVVGQIIPAWRAAEIDQEKTPFMNFLFHDAVIVILMILSSILSGFGSATYWVAQGHYVSLCASENSKGFYYGFFWTFYMASEIFGNGMGSILILQASGPEFFIIMAAIMLGACFFMCLLRKPNPFPNQEDHHEEEQTTMEGIKSTLKLMFSKKMLLVLPQLIWTGVSISYWSAILTPIIKLQLGGSTYSDKEKDSEALKSMIWFGIGEVLGGLGSGYICDKIGSKFTSFVNVSLILCTGVITIFAIKTLDFIVAPFMCLIWGLMDGAVNIHCFQILGFEFESHSEPFGVFNMAQGIAIAIIQSVQSLLNDENADELLIYTIFVIIYGCIACLLPYFVQYKPKNKNRIKNIEDHKLLEYNNGDINNTPTISVQRKTIEN